MCTNFSLSTFTVNLGFFSFVPTFGNIFDVTHHMLHWTTCCIKPFSPLVGCPLVESYVAVVRVHVLT